MDHRPRRLGHGHGFAGDVRLVDAACAGDHLAIAGHPRAGAQHDDVAGNKGLGRNFLDLAIGAFSQRGFGTQLHQRLDRVAGTAQCAILQRAGDAEQ